MVHWRRTFGNAAEQLAQRFLVEKGYRILDTQYVCAFGEVDIIARDGDEIVLVEVKARTSSEFGAPEESVTARKLEKIYRAGEWYLRVKGLQRVPYRIDVVAIQTIGTRSEIHHIQAVES